MNEIDVFGMQTVDAIKQLVIANRYLQALVVLYSAIDTFAWVNRPSGDVTAADFCKWVDTYMKPEVDLGCTSNDLYAARCAIVHSGAAESKMSREGRASEIWYVTSAESLDRLQSLAQNVGAKAKVVHFTSLLAAVTDAMMNFSEDLAGDPDREKMCAERMKHWIRFLSFGASNTPADNQSD